MLAAVRCEGALPPPCARVCVSILFAPVCFSRFVFTLGCTVSWVWAHTKFRRAGGSLRDVGMSVGSRINVARGVYIFEQRDKPLLLDAANISGDRNNLYSCIVGRFRLSSFISSVACGWLSQHASYASCVRATCPTLQTPTAFDVCTSVRALSRSNGTLHII